MRGKTNSIIALAAVIVMAAGCASVKERFKKALEQARTGMVPTQETSERRPAIVKKQLPNGLTVVVEENFSAPVAAVQVWVKVGSADETDKEAGLAHLLEHMVFKGTTKRGVGETAMEVESMGGDLNAFTSYDVTCFHVTLASRYYDRAMDILSDLVRNAVFDPAELTKEREVVLEEIRRGMDNPRSRIYKYLFDEAYKKHNYRRPVIGFEETVSSFGRDDVAGFYHKWYVPSNMTVVVTGSVKAEDVMASAQKWFGDMPDVPAPSGESSPRSITEPPQKQSRARVYYEDVSDGYMYVGFHIPAFGAQDMAALDVLSVIMGGGDTSRLVYRVRTERGLVNKVWGYDYTPRDPGMFLVGADLSEEKAADALSMILKQIYLFKHEPVEEWELDKAKVAIDTENIYSRETVDGQARRIGNYQIMVGNPDYDKVYNDAVKAVTREDLMRVANKYFTGENLSAVAILPEKAADEKNPKRFDQAAMRWVIQDVDGWEASYQHGSLTEPEPITPPEVPKPEETPSEEGAAPVAAPPVKFVLANGIRLIVRENHSVPLVSVRAAFSAGLRRETRELNGINNFLAETVTEGTINHSANDIHSMIEARAGSLEGFSGRNSMGVTLEVPSEFFHSCLPILGEVIRYPTFNQDEVEKKRGIIISDIKSKQDQPAAVAFRIFRAELYQEHPFGMDVLGTEQSVAAITRDDLMNYYQSFAVPGNLVIAVVGDVKANEVKESFDKMFDDWVAEPYSPPPVPAEPRPTSIRETEECRDVNQTNIVIGFQGTRVTSDDRYPLAVMNSVLSGMSGRLFTVLRGKQSLAYSVFAFGEEGVDPGFLGVYIGCAPDKEQTAKQGIIKQLDLIRTEPITQEELDRAQEVLIGDFEIGLQKFSAQAANYALDELNGLGFRASQYYTQKIQAVDQKDVLQAAQKYIQPEAYVYAAVRPCGTQASAE